MTSDTIDYFMSQPDGANYVVLYQMLCLKTINTGGRLSRQIGEIIIPYDVEKIHRDCKWFSIDTVRVALKLYQAVGLIYEDVDGTLVLTDHKNLVGSETNCAEQKRNQRELKRSDVPQLGGQKVDSDVDIVHPDIRDRDKRLEIDTRDRGEDVSVGGDETPPPPPPPPAPPSAPSQSEKSTSPAVIYIPLNDGSEYPVTQEDIDKWKDLYQAVDIMQELKKMRGWADANPKKRKTKNGIKRFINSWLASEQDKYHGSEGGGTGGRSNTHAPSKRRGTYV